MLAIFESILPIFLAIMAGAMLRRTRIMDEGGWRGLEQIGYWVLYPVLLFLTVLKADFSVLALDSMMAALLGTVLLVAFLVMLTWPIFRGGSLSTRAEFSSIFQTAVRWNGFVALAVAQKLYPPEAAAVVALVMAVIIIPINIMSVTIVSRFGHGGANIGRIASAMVSNPLIIGVAAGIAMRYVPFGLYEPVSDMLTLVSNAALGIAMLSVGAGLKFGHMATLRPAVWFPVIVKLVLMPAVMLSMGLALGVTGPSLVYICLCGSVPTAMNGYTLARQLGGDAEFYAAVATIQTALAAITMPAVLGLAAQLSAG